MKLFFENINQTNLNEFISLFEVEDNTSLESKDFFSQNRDEILSQWEKTPALLFRGFNPSRIDKITEIFSDPLEYTNRSTPRTEVNKGVYTATEYPSNLEIVQHCENAYHNKWPLYLFFQCEKSASTGGETPLSDVRKVTQYIPEHIKEKFKKHGVKYVRNYRPGLDIPWQTVFQTESQSAVEQYCHDNNMQFEWVNKHTLKTSQTCQGMAIHPITKEELWFNQAHLFHKSNLAPEVLSFLEENYSEQELPRNAYYGNGEPIDEDDLKTIRTAFSTFKYDVSWQNNDILLIDNMRCSHGRNPYTGERKVFVSMSKQTTNQHAQTITV